MEKTRIELGNKVVTLIFENLDLEIEVENYTQIDQGNLVGEILTFPAFFSQLAHLRAEAMATYDDKKVEVKIYEAKQREYYRKKLFKEKEKRPSNQEVDDAVMIDPGYEQKHKQLINRQRDFEYLDAMYWSAKSKDGKLNKLADSLSEKSLEEIVDGVCNGIVIRTKSLAMPKK